MLVRTTSFGATANRALSVIALTIAIVVAMPQAAFGADPENCLLCHRYRGLVRVEQESGLIKPFYVSPDYYDRMLGPHARLKCTDCHPRDEVGVIPHKPTSPVNCTSTCHLAGPMQMPVTFSHAGIDTALSLSVHNDETLAEANRLMGGPLAQGQSQCLLCHDEPKFVRPDDSWAERQAHIDRCNVCHTEELPKDTRYYYWHVVARARPARSGQDLVRVCSTCHADDDVREHFGLPNSVASYLTSFHGKAMLLGSDETADCLDCHVAELANVHLMKSSENPAAPTSEARVADTCRSPECHPTASHAISSAAIHLDLSTSRGIEYFIGAIFFLLILSTFGPSVMITTLDLLQIVVGRHDPTHHRHLTLAQSLMSDPRGREKLVRFTPHQRVQHWVLFASFTLLVLTGFPIKFADRAWAAWLIDTIGSLSLARHIHRWAGVVLMVGFAYHLAYVAVFALRESRRTGKGLVRTFMGLPMMMQLEDLVHMRELLKFLLFMRKTRPPAGRFSLEQKFEYFGVFWGSMLLGLTGILMWANAWTSGTLGGRILTIAALVHTFEAFLALLHVGIVHMVGVIFTPVVFPVSPAMVSGDTPPEKLVEGHAGLLERVADELKIAPKEAHHDS